MNTPRYIIIHCTDYSYRAMFDQYAACNRWHKERDFSLSSLGLYIGYQRLITGDKNYQCRLDTDVGCHCNQGIDSNGRAVQSPTPGTSMNYQSLGVCLGLAGDIELPTGIQHSLLQKQVWEWQDKYKISNDRVFFHRKFALNKTCPGMLITDQWLADLLRRPLPVPAVQVVPADCAAQEQVIVSQAKQIGFLQSLVDALKEWYNRNK